MLSSAAAKPDRRAPLLLHVQRPIIVGEFRLYRGRMDERVRLSFAKLLA
jgi:hypothetical protein